MELSDPKNFLFCPHIIEQLYSILRLGFNHVCKQIGTSIATNFLNKHLTFQFPCTLFLPNSSKIISTVLACSPAYEGMYCKIAKSILAGADNIYWRATTVVLKKSRLTLNIDWIIIVIALILVWLYKLDSAEGLIAMNTSPRMSIDRLSKAKPSTRDRQALPHKIALGKADGESSRLLTELTSSAWKSQTCSLVTPYIPAT